MDGRLEFGVVARGNIQSFDKGWEAGAAWAQAEIAKMLNGHDFGCQSNPGIQCEACVRDNVASEVERGVWKR